MTVLLTADEGDALATLDAWLGRGPAPRRAATLDAVRPELARVAAQRMASCAVRYLVEAGGWRERTVLRGGRRATGRLWDAAVDNGFALRFTPISYDLARGEPSRVGPDAGSGGAVFFALAIGALRGFGLGPEDHRALADRLRDGSVLALLVSPAACDGAAVRARLEATMRGPDVRILECVDDALLDAWTAHARETWAQRTDVAAAMARWRALGTLLHAYLDAADSSARLDLTRAVMRFAAGLCAGVFSESGAAVRAAISNLPRLRDVAERDEYLRVIARVVATASWLLARRDAMAAQRYGDERYDEAQLFLRFVGESLLPARDAVDDVARALSSTIG